MLKKTKLALFVAPMAALALGLSACGGGSTPGASTASSSTSAAPTSATSAAPTTESSETSSAPSTETSAPETSGSSAAAGAADERAAAFIKANAGFTALPSATLKAQLQQTVTALDAVTMEPAACKAKAIETVKGMPDSLDVAMAMKAESAGASSVAFYEGGADWYKSNADLTNSMLSECNGMKQSAAGQEYTVSMEKWDVPGVQGDVVYGTVETTKMPTGSMVQTKAFASTGDSAVLVQIMGSKGGAEVQAEVAKLLKAALAG